MLILIAAGGFGCGGSSDATNVPPAKMPPTAAPQPSFPSAAGTWTGTVNYRTCDESPGFGYCGTVTTPRSTAFRTTINQSAQTHSDLGLIVADVSGTMSFDGITGTFTGAIDDIGSIFYDKDVFVAPLPGDRSLKLDGWTGQLFQESWFASFRMTITSTKGVQGQAVVNVNMTDVVRATQ
ncbi:MAG TPA: hypothetical protein VGN65_03315 [Casimicrobiaceae bacterium]|jgi:hypothetical protein